MNELLLGAVRGLACVAVLWALCMRRFPSLGLGLLPLAWCMSSAALWSRWWSLGSAAGGGAGLQVGWTGLPIGGVWAELGLGTLLGTTLALPPLALAWVGGLWDRLWIPAVAGAEDAAGGIIGRLFAALGVALFAAFDGLHSIVRVFYASLLQRPPGTVSWPAELSGLAVWWAFWQQGLDWALWMAGPGLLAYLLARLGTAVLVRLATPYGVLWAAWAPLWTLVPALLLWASMAQVTERFAGQMGQALTVARRLLRAF